MNKVSITALAVILLGVLSIPPQALSQTIRVLVMDGLPGLTLHVPGEYKIDGAADGAACEPEGTGGTKLVLGGGAGLAAPLRLHAGDSVVNVGGFALTGVVEIRPDGKGRYGIINELDLEEYTRAVVGEEMSSKWPMEALKAQAVVVRTYALYRKWKSAQANYDLCATVNSQVFTGGAREKDAPARAARQTEGEILSCNGELVETLFHASCGGSTESAEDVWSRRYPYLVARDCGCEKESPFASWEKTFPADEIEMALNKNGYGVGDIKAIKISRRSRTGRVKALKVVTSQESVSVKGADFRRMLGYSRLPSTMFEVRKEGGMFIFLGKGSGHGVGLCQWGAKTMADDGRDYRDILQYYYTGTTLSKIVSEPGR